jgi:hypothetical protein
MASYLLHLLICGAGCPGLLRCLVSRLLNIQIPLQLLEGLHCLQAQHPRRSVHP